MDIVQSRGERVVGGEAVIGARNEDTEDARVARGPGVVFRRRSRDHPATMGVEQGGDALPSMVWVTEVDRQYRTVRPRQADAFDIHAPGASIMDRRDGSGCPSRDRQ